MVELRVLATEMTTAELGEHFNREWTSIKRKCQSLGIVTQSKHVEMRDYTEYENQYIIAHSRYMRSLELGEKLGRTPASIRQHINRLRKQGIDVPAYLRSVVKRNEALQKDTNYPFMNKSK